MSRSVGEHRFNPTFVTVELIELSFNPNTGVASCAITPEIRLQVSDPEPMLSVQFALDTGISWRSIMSGT